MASRVERPRTWPAALDDTGALLVLGMLIAADGFFVVLHLVNFYGPQPWERVNTVNNDWAHAEVFQYLKYLWAIGLFGVLALRGRRPDWLVWIPVWGFLALSDMYRFHEHVGRITGELLPETGLPITRTSLGELVAALVVFSILVPLFWLVWRRADPAARRRHRPLLHLLIAFLFFGVVLDGVHALVAHISIANGLVTLAEDGGEMLVLSALTAYVFHLCREPHEGGVRAEPVGVA